MKKKSVLFFLIIITTAATAQEVLRIQNGGIVAVQNGVELTLQGGLTLENGSGLANNGWIRLKNNIIANESDWNDYSSGGALIGTGKVIFNSIHLHNYSGLSDFYWVQMNAAGLNLNSHLTVSERLELINGRINTGNYYAFLNNNNTSSLLNDVSNSGYSNSWINGNFRRLITSNNNSYDFPVGNSTRCNLLQFLNNHITGTGRLTASFGPKPGTDAGLNVSEMGADYDAVNNGGVWYLAPDVSPSGGDYALHLFFNGFTGLTNNQFGILRRHDASNNAADWMVPPGSVMEVFNGTGRKLSDGFARRKDISDFSQLGIGMFSTIPCENCIDACTYTHGFYGNSGGTACYINNSGFPSTITSKQLMLNAFGATASKVFGNVANKRFFTLYKTDISNGNIFKMLPGSGNSLVLGVDNVSPYNGAFYADQSTWSLVPMQPSGSKKGRINNLLLAQTIALWFSLSTSNSLGTIDLSNETLVTIAQTSCGSGIPAGSALEFDLPHNVITYLNGGYGYTNNVNGLFQLANDVLGGANTALSPSDVQNAIATVNLAFDGCRILMRTIPYGQTVDLITRSKNTNKQVPLTESKRLLVTAFPNPYNKEFSLRIMSPVSGVATIEFFAANGARIHQTRKPVIANAMNIVHYTGTFQSGILFYKITIDDQHASGIVIGSVELNNNK